MDRQTAADIPHSFLPESNHLSSEKTLGELRLSCKSEPPAVLALSWEKRALFWLSDYAAMASVDEAVVSDSFRRNSRTNSIT